MSEFEFEFFEIGLMGGWKVYSENQFENLLNTIRNIDLPVQFQNRMVNVDFDSPSDTRIIFGRSGDIPPDKLESNSLTFRSHVSEEDDEIEDEGDQDEFAHVVFNSRFSNEFSPVVYDIINQANVVEDNPTIANFLSYCQSDIGFDEFDLPSFTGDGKRSIGVRFTTDDDDVEFLIQNLKHTRTYSDTDEDIYNTTIRYENDNTWKIEEMGHNFIDERIQEITEEIEELVES